MFISIISFTTRFTLTTHFLVAQFRESVDDDAKDEIETDRSDDDEERELVERQQNEVGERLAACVLVTRELLQPHTA